MSEPTTATREEASPDTGRVSLSPQELDRKSRITALVVTIGLIVVAALVVFIVLGGPQPEARPTSLGFSLNSFFQWIGDLHPLVQIPVILLVFAAVAGILLVLIEYAPRAGRGYFWVRLGACLVLPFLAFMLLRPYQNAVLYVVIISLILGGLLFFADMRARQGRGYLFQLFLFVAPATMLILIGIIYPAIATLIQSFFDKTGDTFVGLENYVWAFTNPEGFWSVVNSIIWALLVPTFATAIGLAYGVLIERARGERILKILVFIPFAVSLVATGITWKFVYDYRQGDQIGILNAVVVAFGGEPVAWLDAQPLWNTLFIIIAYVWTQTGFAMVVLSAAIKAVPVEQMEAAELDGANAWERFRNVTVPGIRPTLIVVLTTVTVFSLKVYDLVANMTGGRSNTTILAFEMVNQQQRFQSYGHAAALAVVLFLLVMPLIIYNAVELRKQREIR